MSGAPVKKRTRITKEWELALHSRLIGGDPIASAEIAEQVLDYVVAVLRKLFPHQNDESLYDEAASQALIDYFAQPAAFDPSKARLSSYLVLAARNDLKTLIARRMRITSFEKSLFVEQPTTGENKLIEVEDKTMTEDILARRLDLELAKHIILQNVTNERDRQLLELMDQRVRDTEEYASILNIQHLDSAEQRRIVKQHKDRLDKIVERIGEELRGRKIQ